MSTGAIALAHQHTIVSKCINVYLRAPRLRQIMAFMPRQWQGSECAAVEQQRCRGGYRTRPSNKAHLVSEWSNQLTAASAAASGSDVWGQKQLPRIAAQALSRIRVDIISYDVP